jgi:translation elongation factor EF-Tu-like GTPase
MAELMEMEVRELLSQYGYLVIIRGSALEALEADDSEMRVG